MAYTLRYYKGGKYALNNGFLAIVMERHHPSEIAANGKILLFTIERRSRTAELHVLPDFVIARTDLNAPLERREPTTVDELINKVAQTAIRLKISSLQEELRKDSPGLEVADEFVRRAPAVQEMTDPEADLEWRRALNSFALKPLLEDLCANQEYPVELRHRLNTLLMTTKALELKFGEDSPPISLED